MECERRPNRSDVHLSEEEETEQEAKARDYFDGVTPKRHSKPQRSEHSSQYTDTNSTTRSIPELSQFQRLENHPDDHHSQKIVYSGSQAAEEFVETDYYDDLNGIDKQHHTTGTGFIQFENEGEKISFKIAPDSGNDCSHHAASTCNPATNDWIPASIDHDETLTSDKPNRSDN